MNIYTSKGCPQSNKTKGSHPWLRQVWGSRGGLGILDDHVDIQVGSCICLNVCLFWSIAYALRWRVAHLG